MATHRMVGFPFAGGGPSVFVPWVKHLPSDIELYSVHLPGRETKARETPVSEWAPTIEAISDLVNALPFGKVTLFGHSLGALLALDVARSMERRGRPAALLGVAGRPWPGSGALSSERSPIADLTDDDFLAAMETRYGSLPASLQNPDIAELVLPILRADLRLLSDYRYTADPALTTDISVYTGSEDPITADIDPRDWANETESRFESHVLKADHYFVDAEAATICASLVQSLKL